MNFDSDGKNPFSLEINLGQHDPAATFHANLLSEFTPVRPGGLHLALINLIQLLSMAEQEAGQAEAEIAQHAQFGFLLEFLKSEATLEGFKERLNFLSPLPCLLGDLRGSFRDDTINRCSITLPFLAGS